MADKRAKVAQEADEKAIQAALLQSIEKLEKVQEQLEEINVKEAEESLKIAQQFLKQKKPAYEERSKIIAQIPGFWRTVFLGHGTLCEFLTDDDAKALQFLENVEVIESDDMKSGYRINFFFSDNPFFEDHMLFKEFRFSDEGEVTVTSTEIKWRPGQDLTQPKESANKPNKRSREEEESFFKWFEPEDQESTLGDLFRDDVWPNPLRIYMEAQAAEEEPGDDEEEDYDDDGDDGDDGEDNGEGDGDEENGGQ